MHTWQPVASVVWDPGGGQGALVNAVVGNGWVFGAVIFLVLQWLAYRTFVRRLDTSSRPARPALYGGIATFVSQIVDGPLALGLLRPRIVVPADFSRRYGPGERRLAMEHELTHHRRGDLWWNVAAILVLAVNWFNPLAWIAFRAFRTDQELACDAAVAARASAEERHQYAVALVKSAARPGLLAACSMNGAGELKRRLRMMRSHRPSRLRSAGGFSALSILAVGGLSLAAATQAPPPPAVSAPRPAAGVQIAAAAPLAVLTNAPTAVAAARRVTARVKAPEPRASARAAWLDRPRLALAAVEPKLEPLSLLPMRLPRLRILPTLASAAPDQVNVRITQTLVLRASSDPAVREQVRAALEEALGRNGDAETRIRVERALGGAYVATIVNDRSQGE